MKLSALSILWAATCLAEGPTFEAASVKLFSPDVAKTPLFSGGPGSDDPGRLHLRVNMSLLLGAAFGVSADQIKGPAWLRDFSAMPFYDIVATMPADSSKRQVEQMLQNLLIERFHLAFHHEPGNFPGYELVVDKGGPKLKEGAPMGSDGFPVAPGPRTGLTGKYTFILEYECPACVPLSANADDSGGFPDIFVAVQKQLGLRLDKAADVPMDVFVVKSPGQ
jgi:hypothetical protein